MLLFTKSNFRRDKYEAEQSKGMIILNFSRMIRKNRLNEKI